MIYPGRMFSDGVLDYDAFFDYGIGAMCWSKDDEGRRTLIFLAPTISGRRKWICSEIYTLTDGKDWKTPGPIKGWDGNLEAPTFSPSIWLLNRAGWHGYIEQGNLRTA